MSDRTTSSVAAVPTFLITSASADLMSSHLSESFRRGSIQVRIAILGAGLFASEASWCCAVLRLAAIACSIMLIWSLLNSTARQAFDIENAVGAGILARLPRPVFPFRHWRFG